MRPFNSRPHKEVDSFLKCFLVSNLILSIHDLTRRSTTKHQLTAPNGSFQFTTSQGGRLCRFSQACNRHHLSIHDLTRRSTKSERLRTSKIELSIHDLTRRSTVWRKKLSYGRIFQFTTSQGGRLEPGLVITYMVALSIHDLTRRSTSGTDAEIHIYELSIHDLTRRSTNRSTDAITLSMPFNSRPHKEVDLCFCDVLALLGLSIHDLTRRSTSDYNYTDTSQKLSIHDLTRRSTHRTRLHMRCCASFNSRPHKEVDVVSNRYEVLIFLSIHDLTRRSTRLPERI